MWYEEKKSEFAMRNQTHDLLVPRSNVLPLSQTGKLNGKPGDYKVHAKASFFPFPHMFHDLTQKLTVKNYSTDICWLIDLSFIKEQFYN